MLIDTHAHLDYPEFSEDLDEVLQRAEEAGVTRIITIGTGLESSRRAVALAEKYLSIHAVVGIHPTYVQDEVEDFLPELRSLAEHPSVLLKTMVEKELGLTHRLAEGSPLQGALIMGAAFGLGAAVPVIPYVLLPIEVAIWASVVATGAVLFGIGVVKSRWTRRSWLRSGTEILLLGAVAGIAGFLFGDILPGLLGVQPIGS